MKIAILSDTHGLLRPQVKEILSGCDGAIHGGDINSKKILDEIKAAIGEDAPFYVVRGNNDKEWAKDLPLSLSFELQNVKCFLVHNKKDVPENLDQIQLVIYGHSHKYSQEMKDGRLWLNPGSCGKRRFYLPVTMAILHLGEGTWRVEKIEMDGEEPEKVPKEELTEGKLVGMVEEIFRRMDRGQNIEYIAGKVGLEAELVEQICRIRVTHPGVTANGVVDKMEVNRVVIKSGK